MIMEPSVTIPVPEELTAEEIYFYLLHNPEGRQKLFKLAEGIRFSQWDSVFVKHPSVPYPFLFTPTLVDGNFVAGINTRLDVLLSCN